MRPGGGGNSPHAGGYSRQPGGDHCHHYRHHAGQSGRGDGADERGGDDDGAAEDACPPDPSNQCHVTNLKDNPVQIAADAAEAGIRGFSEQETTVGIARYAPFNAPGAVGRFAVRPPRRVDAVLGGRGHRAGAGHAWLNQLRRDGVGLRHGSGIYRRR